MLVLNDHEVEAITEACNYVRDTGYKDKTVTLIEAVAAITTIETIMSLASKKDSQLRANNQLKDTPTEEDYQ